jgi:transposase
MMLIGIDPHKSTHTATAIAPDANHAVASIRIDATLGEYRRMLTWARQWPQRRWAVENAEGLGRHLTSWLLARGEDVVDVSTTGTARVRQLSRGGGRKNDRIDAGAAACVAALQGDARPLQAEGYADAMAVFDERRVNLAQSRVRAVNQLHALLRPDRRRPHLGICPLPPQPPCCAPSALTERWSRLARQSPKTS